MLKVAFAETGDDYSQMITTLSADELAVVFYTGYGLTYGVPFTAWGEKYVYFPVGYDGSEWVGWAPRNPCDIKCDHIGGS